MAAIKINKEFCLSDDSVNVYGYRLLTSGLQMSRFVPAIGYKMHKRDDGVAVRWEDIRTEEGKLFGKPIINATLYPDLAQQIEDGFYVAASVGHIVVLEMTDDDAYKLEGQTGPTVLKWFPRECSIVDIPGNYNAIAKLYDESDNVICDLSDSLRTTINFKQMDKPTIELAALGLPDLAANATAVEVQQRIRDLIAEAAKVPVLTKELNDLKAEVLVGKVQVIIDKGLSDRKLTNEMAAKLKADYAGNPEGLQALVDTLPTQTLVSKQTKEVPDKYQGKTYRDLYLSGELEDVKKNYPDLYDQLKKGE